MYVLPCLFPKTPLPHDRVSEFGSSPSRDTHGNHRLHPWACVFNQPHGFLRICTGSSNYNGLPCNPSLDSHQDGCIVNAVGTVALENKKAAMKCTLLADPFGTFFDKYPTGLIKKPRYTLKRLKYLSARTTPQLYHRFLQSASKSSASVPCKARA